MMESKTGGVRINTYLRRRVRPYLYNREELPIFLPKGNKQGRDLSSHVSQLQVMLCFAVHLHLLT